MTNGGKQELLFRCHRPYSGDHLALFVKRTHKSIHAKLVSLPFDSHQYFLLMSLDRSRPVRRLMNILTTIDRVDNTLLDKVDTEFWHRVYFLITRPGMDYRPLTKEVAKYGAHFDFDRERKRSQILRDSSLRAKRKWESLRD